MKERIFSYGTLQKEKVQLELFGRTLQGSNDTVSGYALSSIIINDVSVVSKSEQTQHLIAVAGNEDDKINGMVFEITPQELMIADEYETDDYKRIKVTLDSGKQAWIYVAADSTPPKEFS
jgi:gamma-glutamylcyclotransferase (GGCT)/AIG2-like uncharacterized protein YtfP